VGELTWRDFLLQLDGAQPADPGQLHEVLALLREQPIAFADKKRALILWLDRAGLPLKGWMVEALH